ncbi:MAG: nuclear transport factor 2 family protein [Dehalococcoidia bacterium]
MSDPIADRLAVQDVMTRYAIGVDTRDFELYESCFAEDVAVSGFGRGEPIRGRAAWMAFARKALERFGPTQHFIGNHLVELQGDEADLRTYVQATHVLAADPQAVFTLWATYHTRLRREPGGWRIVEHRLEPQASQTLRGDPRP